MFIRMFLTHTSFSYKLFCDELQTYRAFILFCKILSFRNMWMHLQEEEKIKKCTSSVTSILLSVVWQQFRDMDSS